MELRTNLYIKQNKTSQQWNKLRPNMLCISILKGRHCKRLTWISSLLSVPHSSLFGWTPSDLSFVLTRRQTDLHKVMAREGEVSYTVARGATWADTWLRRIHWYTNSVASSGKASIQACEPCPTQSAAIVRMKILQELQCYMDILPPLFHSHFFFFYYMDNSNSPPHDDSLFSLSCHSLPHFLHLFLSFPRAMPYYVLSCSFLKIFVSLSRGHLHFRDLTRMLVFAILSSYSFFIYFFREIQISLLLLFSGSGKADTEVHLSRH